MKRIYMIDNKEILSGDVNGFLHIASKDHGNCTTCGKPVKKGQKRVRLNIFECDAPFHFDCYLGDHESIILGLGISTRRRYGINRTIVNCKEFVRGKE